MDKFSTFPFLFYEILAYVHDIFFSFCVDSVERLACSIYGLILFLISLAIFLTMVKKNISHTSNLLRGCEVNAS